MVRASLGAAERAPGDWLTTVVATSGLEGASEEAVRAEIVPPPVSPPPVLPPAVLPPIGITSSISPSGIASTGVKPRSWRRPGWRGRARRRCVPMMMPLHVRSWVNPRYCFTAFTTTTRLLDHT